MTLPFNASKDLIRPLIRFSREASVWGRIGAQALADRATPLPGKWPRLVLMPAYGPQGAALLRIYRIATALRSFGWRCLILPPGLTLAQRHRVLARIMPDALLMQGSRHPLNRPSLYPGQRIVYDLDDADFHLTHLKTPVTQAMGQVHMVLAGSDYIAEWCKGAGARDVRLVWTSSPVSSGLRPPQASRPAVLAWAQSRPMDYTQETEIVARVSRRVAKQHPGVRLRLYDQKPGDDPGFADRFRAPGLTVEWMPAQPYHAYLKSFDDVAVGLAPLSPQNLFSRGKSFGKILAYLDRKVPVVLSDMGEPKAFFSESTGVLCQTEDEWVRGVLGLLQDDGLRTRTAQAAHLAFEKHLSTQAVAARVSGLLSELIAGDAKPLAG